MSLKELNGRLNDKPYLSGFSPSKEDAKALDSLIGENTNVLQWAARVASYYASERAAILTGGEKTEATPAPAPKEAAPAPKAEEKKEAAAEEDDDDLFAEPTEEEKAALEAKKAEAEKKPKKVVIAKSSILMDIKPWDDTIDLEALSTKMRAVEKDGLVWGDHKLVPVAFGVKKLQQLIVIEDDKVSSDDIDEMIVSGFEDEVQSMDIVAWNKI